MAFGTGNVIQMKSSAPNVISDPVRLFLRGFSRHAAHGDERERRQPEETGELADIDEDLGKRQALSSAQNEKKCEDRARIE